MMVLTMSAAGVQLSVTRGLLQNQRLGRGLACYTSGIVDGIDIDGDRRRLVVKVQCDVDWWFG